ncbi:hypothetical protein R1flu_007337 [Riccia fluitans]|uniref:Uncharacterized protein n=1 Tax=Riccia fluitans TaxID=41844 RepID=A0ABD1YZD7_9MARC
MAAAYARRCQSILNSFLKSPIHSCSPALQLRGNHSLLQDFNSLFHSCAVRQPHQFPPKPSTSRSAASTAFEARREYHAPTLNPLSNGFSSTSDFKAQPEVCGSQAKVIEQSFPHIKNRRAYSAATAAYTQQEILPPSIKSHEDVTITRTGACHVKPALQVQEHWFPLSNMDRLMPSVYEQAYFVYESTKGRPFGDVVFSLKETLSEVLVPFYPLAGRMRNPEGGIYNVHCDGTGAEFAVAHADCELEELDYHQPGPDLGRRLAPVQIFASEDGSLPPVCIQVTKFRCGGVIVGCSFHHQIVDVYSGNMFLKAWSQIMRNQPISRLPYHWRSLLQARSPPKATVDHSNEYRVKLKNESRTPTRVSTTEEEEEQQQQPIVARTFHFDSKALQNLKRETSQNGKYGPFTSTECTSTYLWRLIMKANGLEHDENAKGRMIMSVDGRKRLQSPCVPEDYFGNLIAISNSECSMADLVHQPLTNAVQKVQKSIAKTATDENFRSLIDFVELHKGSIVMPNVNVFTDKVVIASSCIHLGMYEIDFGWGRPEFAGYAAVPEGIANFVILLPSPLGYGNLNASIHLRADHMEKLENDPEFESIASANELSDRSTDHHFHIVS